MVCEFEIQSTSLPPVFHLTFSVALIFATQSPLGVQKLTTSKGI